MTAALCRQTFNDLARSVAWNYGIDLPPSEADSILWEFTGFPGFWDGDPRECCEAQLRTFFETSS